MPPSAVVYSAIDEVRHEVTTTPPSRYLPPRLLKADAACTLTHDDDVRPHYDDVGAHHVGVHRDVGAHYRDNRATANVGAIVIAPNDAPRSSMPRSRADDNEYVVNSTTSG